MKFRTIVSLLMVSALVPVAAQAQTTTTTEATGKANAQTRIEAAMNAAVNAKIPTALLESKIAEGKAKGVSQDRIAMAVEARLNGLMRASEALKRAEVEAASQSELAVSADALEAGVSENALVKVSRSAPTERRAVAVATLTGLVQLGHASEVALARVSAALGTNAALANLQAEVASQLQAGAGKGNANVNAGGLIRIR
ncbi:MAG TPA: hypothetical protein VGC44_08370 [Longimicrobiales bacterium]